MGGRGRLSGTTKQLPVLSAIPKGIYKVLVLEEGKHIWFFRKSYHIKKAHNFFLVYIMKITEFW